MNDDNASSATHAKGKSIFSWIDFIRSIQLLKFLFLVLILINLAYFFIAAYKEYYTLLAVQEAKDVQLETLSRNAVYNKEKIDAIFSRLASPKSDYKVFLHSDNVSNCLANSNSLINNMGFEKIKIKGSHVSGEIIDFMQNPHEVTSVCVGNISFVYMNGSNFNFLSNKVGELSGLLSSSLTTLPAVTPPTSAPVVVPPPPPQ